MLRRCLFLALPIWSCMAPTEIVVDVSTDAKCADLQGVAIAIGDPKNIDQISPVTVTPMCADDGTIGKIVLVPSSLDGDVGIRVVGGFKKHVTDCNSPFGDGCIVARRALRYVPHTPLYLPIRLAVTCAGVPCDTTSTCEDGRCVPSKIDDPTQCTTPDAGCAPDGGTPLVTLPFDAECGDMSGLGAGASWPMTQACPTHIGRTPYRGPVARPAIAWKFQSGSTPQLSVPVVSSDRTVYFGTLSGTVTAIDLLSGTPPKWSASTSGPLSANGAIAADGTFVIGGSLDFFGYDTVTHTPRWKTGMRGADVTIGPGEIAYQAANSTLRAVDVSTGAELWNVTTQAASTATFAAPAISLDGKSLYLSADDGSFAIVDLVSHTVGATVQLAGTGVPIALSWGYIVPTIGSLYAYDFKNALAFSVPQTTNACAAIAKDGTVVTTKAASVIGVSPITKSIVWTTPVPANVTSCLVIDGNGIVYGVTTASDVVAIDPQSPAAPLWILNVPQALDVSLARENTLLVVTDDGFVIALR